MENIFLLKPYAPLWTKDRAKAPYAALENLLAKVDNGGFVLIDLKGVDGFDFSFANEFFGRTLITLKLNKSQKIIAVTNLSDDNRANLKQALEALDLFIVEKQDSRLSLVGKVHPADEETFAKIASQKQGITASKISEELGIRLNTANERLTKLAEMSVVLRGKDSSDAGREQYVYRTIS